MNFWQATNRSSPNKLRLTSPHPVSGSTSPTLPIRSKSTVTPPQTSVYHPYAKTVISGLNVEGKTELKDVLSAVWNNREITAVCPDLVIRLTSLRGEISKLVWKELGNNPDDIQVLAVGTTAIPQHLPRYHKFLRDWLSRSEKLHQEAKFGNDFVIGYDLLSKGSRKSTDVVMDLFNDHYGFSESQLEDIKPNVAITAGGMRGLKDLVDAMMNIATSNNQIHRFIQPDNSFGTWWNIIERGLTKPDREIHILQGRPENKLHLSVDDVTEFYRNNKPYLYESWYITPVGNPSGTKMTPEQLTSVCTAIYKYNPNAIIILDTVYARTLSPATSRKMFAGLLSKPQVLSRIMFVESFSKSHGLCRERLGCYFSISADLFKNLHFANISFSAGPGEYKDYQFQALGESLEEHKLGVADLHDFWQRERLGLFNFLMSKFSYLFDERQLHITPDDMDSPLGLYILLKTKDSYKAQDVFMKTGVLGVDTPLLSGHYIRFSVGQLVKPVYSIEK